MNEEVNPEKEAQESSVTEQTPASTEAAPIEASGNGTEASAPGEPVEPTVVTIRSLLEAGAHFGHQTERWNPKMLKFIYGERNGVHIINLDLTMRAWLKARQFVVDRVSSGGNILFVGTKPQARTVVEEQAVRCGAFHVTTRWLGGMLSNFETIKRSMQRMRKLEELLAESEKPDSEVKLAKKEKLQISRKLEKLYATLGGIRDMRRPPDLLFVVDIIKERIAVAEARKLRIPVIALVDTNCDPDPVEFVIPSNDDASRTLQLFSAALADAVLEGREVNRERVNLAAREAADGKPGRSEQVVESASKGKSSRSSEVAASEPAAVVNGSNPG